MRKRGIPIKKYEQKKRFGDSTYQFIDRHDTKREAQRLQKQIKDRGNLARIIKSKYGYEVWASYSRR